MKLIAQGIQKDFYRLREGSNYFTAVEKTDFDLPQGALTQIVGRSGSGKTTLLNMLAGLLRPTQGRVLLEGEDLYALPDKKLSALRNRAIGVIPQGQSGLSALTVLENVLLPARLFSKDAPPVKKALSLLEEVGIASLRDARPSELSGGEARRMAIARALIMEPGILLADEPTGDLDDENTRQALQLLKSRAQGGASVLLVTHESEAARYADLTFRMDAGRLVRS